MHRIDDTHVAYAWDRATPPVLTVGPGETIEVAVREASDGQLTSSSTVEDLATMDADRANPLTGPVAVEGARPGDALVIVIEDVAVADWGWSAVIPGFGLLTDDFPDPHLAISRIHDDHVDFAGLGLTLPCRPFIGTIGLAPETPGPHGTIPPLRTGGNMDCRDVRPGTVLRLPVEVDGAVLSVGDTHAVQGDGEVCGTAVETPATVRLRVDVERGTDLLAPQLTIPGVPAQGPRHATTGIGADLYTAAQDATRAMIEWLGHHHGLTPVDAYLLCSAIADLRIREIVDAPNWVVSLDLPLDVLAR